jgi:hypothetical protein
MVTRSKERDREHAMVAWISLSVFVRLPNGSMRLVTDDDEAFRHLANWRAVGGGYGWVVYASSDRGRVSSPQEVDWGGFPPHDSAAT